MKLAQVFYAAASILVILLTGMGCSPSNIGTATTTPAPVLALVHATLIDGTGADPVPDAVVLISGEEILAAGPADQVAVPAEAQVIDLTGTTILPGFINAHVHRGFSTSNLKAWAEGGVTTIRDEGAPPGTIADLKAIRAEAAADPHYARLVSSGTMLGVPGGYGDLFVSSPDEARQAVLKEIDEGVDAIKIAIEDGYAGQHALPKLTPEELKAIVETAHAHNLPVSGHLTQAAYLRPLLEAGVDDIAHLAYDRFSDAHLQQMVAQGVALTPTFTVFLNYGSPPGMLHANLRRFVALGGRVALGNDYGGGPGTFELGIPMVEIQNMSASGMSPMQILQACTSNAARVLRLDNEIGTVEAGKHADLLIVHGDPLLDLQALTSIRMVIHNGVIIRDEADE